MKKTTPQQNAPQAQPAKSREEVIPSELADLVGGGRRTRTYDLRIMSRQTDTGSKGPQQDTSAESGKVLQNPQPPRNKINHKLEEYLYGDRFFSELNRFAPGDVGCGRDKRQSPSQPKGV